MLNVECVYHATNEKKKKIQEHGLYYDGDRGCYYSYNQADNKFEFHSQVYACDDSTSAEKKQVNTIIICLETQQIKNIR